MIDNFLRWANLYTVYKISCVPKEKPIRLTKLSSKLLINSSAKYYPVFRAFSNAYLNGFDLTPLYTAFEIEIIRFKGFATPPIKLEAKSFPKSTPKLIISLTVLLSHLSA
jgi:hypothetical protein